MKKGSDKAIASVGQKVKPTTKNKSKKQQRRVPSPPTPPPYVPSEYELKRLDNIKRIEAHMNSMFPSEPSQSKNKKRQEEKD
jgi:hypothetical protein